MWQVKADGGCCVCMAPCFAWVHVHSTVGNLMNVIPCRGFCNLAEVNTRKNPVLHSKIAMSKIQWAMLVRRRRVCGKKNKTRQGVNLILYYEGRL